MRLGRLLLPLVVAACGTTTPPTGPSATPVDEDRAGAGEPVVITRGALGSSFQLALVDDETFDLLDVSEACFAEVERVEALFNMWSAESALSRLNADPARTRIAIEPELAAALEQALEFCAETGGAFDPTVGVLLEARGFYAQSPREPNSALLEEARGLIGCGEVTVDAATASSLARVARRPGVILDLSAMAKGWAVDAVVRVLRDNGVRNAFVAASGSTVYALGPGPEGRGWSFVVPGAAGPETWWLRDESVSTSGRATMPYGDEVTRDHVLDPRLPGPSRHTAEMSVFRDRSATRADMASTALLVLGPIEGASWARAELDAHPGAMARLVVRRAEGVRVLEWGAAK